MKKRTISALCTAALLLCCVSGCGTESGTSSAPADGGASAPAESSAEDSESTEKTGNTVSSTQKTSVFSVNGQKLYNSGSALYVINDDNTFEYVENAEQKKNLNPETDYPAYIHVPVQQVKNGSDLLGFDDNDLVLIDLSDLNNVNQKVIYTLDQLVPVLTDKIGENSDEDGLGNETIAYDLLSHAPGSMVDGGDGFLYGVYIPSANVFSTAQPIAFEFYRLARDGSKFEFVGDDVRAYDIAAKDGYIYYFNGGYAYSAENGEQLNASEVGIYRMKLDSTDKTQLVKLELQNDFSAEPYNAMFAAGRLDIVGDELYYIGTDSKLYKIGLDGGSPTEVTSSKCNNYYIDTASDTLYYIKGEFRREAPEGVMIVSVPLQGGDEKELFTTSQTSSLGGYMSVDGDYLYLSNSSYYSPILMNTSYTDGTKETFTPRPCGRRWNLRDGFMEMLYSEIDVVMERGTFDNLTVKSVGKVSIHWEKDYHEIFN